MFDGWRKFISSLTNYRQNSSELISQVVKATSKPVINHLIKITYESFYAHYFQNQLPIAIEEGLNNKEIRDVLFFYKVTDKKEGLVGEIKKRLTNREKIFDISHIDYFVLYVRNKELLFLELLQEETLEKKVVNRVANKLFSLAKNNSGDREYQIVYFSLARISSVNNAQKENYSKIAEAHLKTLKEFLAHKKIPYIKFSYYSLLVPNETLKDILFLETDLETEKYSISSSIIELASTTELTTMIGVPVTFIYKGLFAKINEEEHILVIPIETVKPVSF